MALLRCGGSCSRGRAVARGARPAQQQTASNTIITIIAPRHNRALKSFQIATKYPSISLTNIEITTQSTPSKCSSTKTPRPYASTTLPTFKTLTNPADFTMHIALQNRQRHRLFTAHQRLAVHTLPVPHTTPAIPTKFSVAAIAHTPNALRKPQPHALAAQSDESRSRDLEVGHGEVQDCEAGERSGD